MAASDDDTHEADATLSAGSDAGTPLTSENLPVVAGTVYLVAAELGHGGGGRILRAFDQRLGRWVALKLPNDSRGSAEERFRHEARVTARLEHPGIVPVYEVGRWSNGQVFYAMRLVSGRTLADVLAAMPTLDKRLALLPQLVAVADAMAYAHSQQVIHRDLKPSNIMLGAFGEALVIDWGLAKDLRAPESPAEGFAPEATAPDVVLGTPAFMAPEQAVSPAVDARADVYSLGAVLYALLCGRAPYEGRDVLVQLKRAAPVPLLRREPGAPEELAAIVDKAMRRAPAERYADAGELAADLKRFLDGQLVAAHRYSSSVLLRRWLRRNRRVAAIASLALLALTATVSISVQRIVRERDRARAAQATAETRGLDLLLAQARLLVESKPTEALAYLKSYAASDQSDWPAVWAVAADARSRIVARHVFRGLTGARISPDGRMVAAVDGANVELVDTARATATVLKKGWQPTLFTLSASSVAGAAADGEIRRWELPGGAERTIGTTGEPVDRMVIIDAHTLAAAGASGKLYLFGDDGAPTVLTGHTTSVRFLTYDATSRLLATVGCDETVRLWSLAEKKERARIDLSAWTVAFSPDSRQLAVAGPGALITLIDLDGGARRVLRGHKEKVSRVLFSPDGKTLFTASSDQTIRVWDLAGGSSRVLTGHEGFVESLAITRDGRRLASASEDQTVRVWDLLLGESLVLRGHDDYVQVIAFDDDGGRLVSADRSGQVRVWQLPPAPLLVRSPGEPGDVAPRADGTFWAAGEGWLRVYDRGGRELSRQDRAALRPPLAATLDGALAATATSDGGLLLFARDAPAPRELPGHSEVHALTFSPDGETLASGGDDRVVHLWNTRDGSAKASLTGHREAIWVLEFSPDGKWLASGGDESSVRLWNLSSGRVRELPAVDLVYATAFSGDGRWFAWTTGDRTVSLVRLDKEEAPRLYGGHAAAVRAVALSPDGRRLVTGSDDHTARLCRLDGKSVCIVLPHGGPVRMAHFSADGRVLITSSDDRTVRLWDVESAAELSLFRAEHTYVSARLSQDAAYLTAIFKDEPFVRVWPTALAPPAASSAWLDQLTSVAQVPGGEIASRIAPADRH